MVVQKSEQIILPSVAKTQKNRTSVHVHSLKITKPLKVHIFIPLEQALGHERQRYLYTRFARNLVLFT